MCGFYLVGLLVGLLPANFIAVAICFGNAPGSPDLDAERLQTGAQLRVGGVDERRRAMKEKSVLGSGAGINVLR